MKRRMNLLLVAVVVMMGAMLAILSRSQNSTVATGEVPAMASEAPTLRIQVQTPAAQTPGGAVAAGGSSARISRSAEPAALADTHNAAAAPLPVEQVKAKEPVKRGAGEQIGYPAVAGDTLSDVATGLLGSDSKKNRDAVMVANPSLQANPDRVLAGKTYTVPPSDAVTIGASPAVQSAPVPSTRTQAGDVTHSDSDRVLKYTAQAGDSVSALAAGLLGSDSKTNRDAIIGENRSLQNDPDRVVAGKTYKIPTTGGLSAAPVQASARLAGPTSQPDADGVVEVGSTRELRYTARTGDNVSKLAEALLGSDTQANRDAIINNNASLKADPDRVVAGQTYWIPAPAAVVEKP